MKVIIIGGGGFVGKSISQKLKQRLGVKVVSLSRSSTPSFDITISPSQEVRDTFKHSNLVINCTGILYSSGGNTFDAVQVHGARHIAQLAQECNAQLLHISAIGADSNSDIAYSRTKAIGEQAAFKECRNTTVFRPSIVFGKEDQFFNRFARLARYMPFLPVFGGGSSKVIGNKDAIGKIYELGGPTIYTYKQLMQLTLDSAGLTRPILHLPWIVGAVQGWFLEKLPVNLFTVTQDQVKQLRYDNTVGKDALTAKDLGVDLTRAEDVLQSWMKPYVTIE